MNVQNMLENLARCSTREEYMRILLQIFSNVKQLKKVVDALIEKAANMATWTEITDYVQFGFGLGDALEKSNLEMKALREAHQGNMFLLGVFLQLRTITMHTARISNHLLIKEDPIAETIVVRLSEEKMSLALFLLTIRFLKGEGDVEIFNSLDKLKKKGIVEETVTRHTISLSLTKEGKVIADEITSYDSN